MQGFMAEFANLSAVSQKSNEESEAESKRGFLSLARTEGVQQNANNRTTKQTVFATCLFLWCSTEFWPPL